MDDPRNRSAASRASRNDGVTRAEVWLELRDGAISGSTGVNRLRGTYAGDPPTVVGAVATTMRSGPEPAMDVERRVLSTLGDGAPLSVDHDRLVLGTGTAMLTFVRVDPHPDGDWTVTAVHRPERQAVVSDGRPQRVLIAGSHVAVSTPSGSTDGSVALGGAGRHSMAVSTGALPVGADPADVALVDALGRVRSWSLDGPVLHLNRDDGGIAVTLARDPGPASPS